jgi:hypothetical protein
VRRWIPEHDERKKQAGMAHFLARPAKPKTPALLRLSSSVPGPPHVFYYFLLLSTVLNVVCDWKPLATAGMKCQSKFNSFNGIVA